MASFVPVPGCVLPASSAASGIDLLVARSAQRLTSSTGSVQAVVGSALHLESSSVLNRVQMRNPAFAVSASVLAAVALRSPRRSGGKRLGRVWAAPANVPVTGGLSLELSLDKDNGHVGSAPRFRVSGESGAACPPGVDALDFVAWERRGNQEFFMVRSWPDGAQGWLGTGSGRWALHLPGSSEDGVWPLQAGVAETLLSTAADAVPEDAECGESDRMRHERRWSRMKGDLVVCFDADHFVWRLRSSAMLVPVMLPHGAKRLQLGTFDSVVASASKWSGTRMAQAASDVGEDKCGGRWLEAEEAVSTPMAGSDVEATYVTEMPIKSAGWFLSEDITARTPQLLDALAETPAWRRLDALPILWTEDTCKLFVGDAGTGTRPHEDVLWLSQLCLMLSGCKRLIVAPAAEGAPATVVAGYPGDLVAFNASCRHRATNLPDAGVPVAALYQGFLPVAGVPRFCAAPAYIPTGQDDRRVCAFDVIWGNDPLQRKLQHLQQTWDRRDSASQRALRTATDALDAAEERLATASIHEEEDDWEDWDVDEDLLTTDCDEEADDWKNWDADEELLAKDTACVDETGMRRLHQ